MFILFWLIFNNLSFVRQDSLATLLLTSVDSWELQVVKKTKELISKQANEIAKRADEHEEFITKVVSS